jgi:O-acetyl-ADP-ribose deacetylase (regulator of RNase III)
MIKFVKGDAVKALQDGEITHLVHCCNAFGVMGAGIARQIAATFPDAYKAYIKALGTKGNVDNLGTFSVSESGVINLVGQLHVGRQHRQVHYGAIAAAFVEIKEHLNNQTDPVKLGMPYLMGCGLAGGDWDVMVELITECLYKEAGFDITIYRL